MIIYASIAIKLLNSHPHHPSELVECDPARAIEVRGGEHLLDLVRCQLDREVPEHEPQLRDVDETLVVRVESGN